MYALQSIFNFVSFLQESKVFNVSLTMQLKGSNTVLGMVTVDAAPPPIFSFHLNFFYYCINWWL
ncbi:hypothetical protein C1H46_017030 [Malus baccata]|uniref:Uncharacterized protein n=1 Tax=Malus baccata TaxID=106549 RepID=A0A540MF05_MALBA|nr:hypothetical protein C1H46_017030 [Malus baccata]